MKQSGHAAQKLTKNQAQVMDALLAADNPLSAYAILDLLRDKGLRAPLQVYRALDKLIEGGLVHRLESLNAFVACRHHHCASDALTGFMICDNCGHVEEILDLSLTNDLNVLAEKSHFALKKTILEMHGLCPACHA
jgi:Fur family zinc uptake transcriptional regulator